MARSFDIYGYWVEHMMRQTAQTFQKLAAFEGVDCRIEVINSKYIVNGSHDAGISVNGLYDWLHARRKEKDRASNDAL